MWTDPYLTGQSEEDSRGARIKSPDRLQDEGSTIISVLSAGNGRLVIGFFFGRPQNVLISVGCSVSGRKGQGGRTPQKSLSDCRATAADFAL